MPLTYTYEDAFLKRFCTEAVETRAIAAIAVFGTFPTAWQERLVKAQTYVLAARENMVNEGDVFDVKLRAYSSELSALLPQAQRAAAAAASAVSSASVFSVPLERA